MRRVFVVLSGVPGSGKTTLARPLSDALCLPLLDKDDLLENLFESLGVSTPDERTRLSRDSDALLIDIARRSHGAVLSSFWMRELLSQSSGTPTGWLQEMADAAIVEVLCHCPPRLAAARYAARRRHPGHFDDQKTVTELEGQFEQLAAAGPLDVGPLVQVDTSTQVDVEDVARRVLESLG